MQNLFITLLVNDTLTAPDAGREILARLDQLLPKFYPQRYGHNEPPRLPFEISKLEDAWSDPFIWDGVGDAGGMVAMRQYAADRHGLISLSASPHQVDQDRAVEFLKLAAIRFDADFGFVHLLNPREVEGAAPGTAGFEHGVPAMTVASQDIQEYVPDLYWATLFGPDIIEAVRDEVASAPVHVVEELSGGQVYVQVSESMDDSVEDFERFRAARDAAKAHFTRGFFYSGVY